MKFEFKPTQEDLDNGEPCDGSACALAKCIARELGENLFSHKNCVTWLRRDIVLTNKADQAYSAEDSLLIYPKEEVADFVRDYDNGKRPNLEQVFYIEKTREEVLEFLKNDSLLD